MAHLIGFLIGLQQFLLVVQADNNACCYGKKLVRRKLVANATLFQEFITEVMWPKRTVYFDIDPHMDPVIRHYVSKAVDYFNDNTASYVSCVRWEQRYPDPREDQTKHWVTFVQTRSKAINGEVGYKWFKPNTLVRIGYDFVKNEIGSLLTNGKTKAPDPDDQKGNNLLSLILHEMMHVMGFLHEHQRGDRDCWVYVSDDYIKKNKANIEVLKKWNSYFPTKFPYDYTSVMHYPYKKNHFYGHYFNDQQLLGRRDGEISEIDKYKIMFVYCNGPAYCDEYPKRCQQELKSYRYNPKCFREGEHYNRTRTTCSPCQKN